MPREVDADLEATAYATEDDADAVAEVRETAVRTAWDALNSAQKEGALTTASRALDTLDWIGEIADDDQVLEWPRTGTDFSTDAWPLNLVNATIELALSYAPAYVTGSTTNVLSGDVANGNIKRDKTGPLETEYFEPSADDTDVSQFPRAVRNLLRGLVRVVATSGWGSAVVERGS